MKLWIFAFVLTSCAARATDLRYEWLHLCEVTPSQIIKIQQLHGKPTFGVCNAVSAEAVTLDTPQGSVTIERTAVDWVEITVTRSPLKEWAQLEWEWVKVGAQVLITRQKASVGFRIFASAMSFTIAGVSLPFGIPASLKRSEKVFVPIELIHGGYVVGRPLPEPSFL